MDVNIAYELQEPAPIGSYGKQYHVRGRLETNAPLLEHVLFEIEQQNLRYVLMAQNISGKCCMLIVD